MRVKITRNTVAQGNPVFVGDELELSKDEAHLLIAMGKAIGVAEIQVPQAAVLHPAETAQVIAAPAVGKVKVIAVPATGKGKAIAAPAVEKVKGKRKP
jgi:hypothetical protein